MSETLDQLTTVNLLNESLQINGKTRHGIWLTLGFSRLPGPTHHQCTPLLLSASQAYSLALALKAAADKMPASPPSPASQMQ